MRLAFALATLALGLGACGPSQPKHAAPAFAAIARSTDLAALPVPVANTHAALSAIAKKRDLAALAAFVATSPTFSSNFGGETDHKHLWEELRTTGVDVAAELEKILAKPYAAYREGTMAIYAWPSIYRADPAQPFDDQTQADFAALNYAIAPGEPYRGWRIAITPAGEVAFFLRGD
jgi:uridine phosphorylase